MKKDYAKKVIVTSLTLALLLSGGALYGTRQLVRAETSEAAVPPDSGGSGDAAKDSKPNRFKSWFGHQGGQPKDIRSEEHRGGRGFPILEEAASVLGMDKDALRTALKDKTLSQIAADKGIAEADLIAKLQSERSKKIDEAVKSGKLTKDQADKLKQKMPEHLKFMVNHTFSDWHYGKHRMGFLPDPDKLASLLGISKEELETQLKAGKSLAEIAAAKGISRDQLIAKLKDELTPWIENMVDRKKGDKRTDQAEPSPAPAQ